MLVLLLRTYLVLKVVTEDEAGAKELAQYDNAVFLFMSPKDIYKLEDLVIKEKEKA